MANYRVRVFETRIDSLFAPSGDAWKFGTKVRQEILEASRLKAPKRTGELAKGMFDGGQLKSGMFGCRGYVGNNVPHALWVHEGTKTIYARPGHAMKVPRRPSYKPGSQLSSNYTYPAKSVRGQKANPWIDEAAKAVLSKYLK